MVLTLVVSASLAPLSTVTAPDSNRTLIGVQGIGAPGYTELVNDTGPVWQTYETAAYFEVERPDTDRSSRPISPTATSSVAAMIRRARGRAIA